MSYLIIGGTKEERQQKALKLAVNKYQVSNFDTFLVNGETSIGIGQIRELQKHLNLKPYNSKFKVAIINCGELLTIEAQNALLKTLEEPNESSILILTAPTPDFLLPTVASRCQIIKLPVKSEIELSPEEFSQCLSLIVSLLSTRVGERLKMVAKIGKSREEIQSWLNNQIFFWREILLERKGKPNPQYVNMLTQSKELNFLTGKNVITIIRGLEKTKNMIEQNINPRLTLEVFFLDLPEVSSHPTPGVG